MNPIRSDSQAIASARYGLSVAVYSLPIWLVMVVVVSLIGKWTEGGPNSIWLGWAVAGGGGILFTVLACVGLRWLGLISLHIQNRRLLKLAWLFFAALCWWLVTRLFLASIDSASGTYDLYLVKQGWVWVFLAAAVFYIVHFMLAFHRRQLELRQLRRDEAARVASQRAFTMRPSALAAGGHIDAYDIVAELGTLKQAYAESRRNGDSLLEFLQYQIEAASDPRFNSPMPLPFVIEILSQELDKRRSLLGLSTPVVLPPSESLPRDIFVEPALVYAVGVFAVEYGLYRKRQGLRIDVSFREAPESRLEIRTNIPGGDLWYVVDETSSAGKAKASLLEVLDRVGARERVVDSTLDSLGCLIFDVSVEIKLAKSTIWESVEQRFGPGLKLASYQDRSEGTTRVYLQGDQIRKVQLQGYCSPKPLLLSEEHNVLRRLEGVDGVPQVSGFEDHAHFSVLSYTKIDGWPIDEYLADCGFERKAWFRCIVGLSQLLHRIHKHGVVHRDLRPDNILVGEDGCVRLIDFDQSVASVVDGWQIDIQGGQVGDILPSHFSLRSLIECLGLETEYRAVSEELQSIWRIGAQSNASSPGREMAYHRWTFGDTELHGERDWHRRWHMIYRAAADHLSGARVLNLGCNLGLLATHCMLYGAETVRGVDVERDILEAGGRLAKAAGVQVEFLSGDLNSADFVNLLLEEDYDVVTLLSVLHWIENKDGVLQILEAAPRVLYEGHGPSSDGLRMLRELGFRKAQLVGYSERLRALYLATR